MLMLAKTAGAWATVRDGPPDAPGGGWILLAFIVVVAAISLWPNKRK